MAFTQKDLDAVEAAIASGELSVKSDGREVTYRSMADLMTARDTIRRGLRDAGAGASWAGLGYSVARFD